VSHADANIPTLSTLSAASTSVSGYSVLIEITKLLTTLGVTSTNVAGASQTAVTRADANVPILASVGTTTGLISPSIVMGALATLATIGSSTSNVAGSTLTSVTRADAILSTQTLGVNSIGGSATPSIPVNNPRVLTLAANSLTTPVLVSAQDVIHIIVSTIGVSTTVIPALASMLVSISASELLSLIESEGLSMDVALTMSETIRLSTLMDSLLELGYVSFLYGDIDTAYTLGDIENNVAIGDIEDATFMGDIEDTTEAGDVSNVTIRGQGERGA
jgi:hypothetical protein